MKSYMQKDTPTKAPLTEENAFSEEGISQTESTAGMSDIDDIKLEKSEIEFDKLEEIIRRSEESSPESQRAPEEEVEIRVVEEVTAEDN